MAETDFKNEDVTRALQGSERICRSNLADMERWGAYNLVKAVQRGVSAAGGFSGFFTFLQAISGATPREMENILGLKARQFGDGTDIYRLSQVPQMGEFLPRGYSTLVDGLELRDGLKQTSSGYRPGYGAWQAVLLKKVSVEWIVSLGPDTPFVPGPHPSINYGR